MNVMNALFDQSDETEQTTEVEDEIVVDDGHDEVVEDEVSDEGEDTETEVEEVKEPSETEETKEEVDEEGLTPQEAKIARAAEGRLAGLLSEREKRQNAERELSEMRARIENYERQQAALQAQNFPDPNNDPTGYAQAVHQAAEQQILQNRFQMSDQMARAKYGAEKVEEAANWASGLMASNPNLRAEMFQQSDPLGWVVEKFERETKLNKFVNDPDALFKEWAEKNGYKPASEIPATPVVAKAPIAPAPKAAPKRAAAAQIASPGLRGGAADAPSSVIGTLGLK